MMALLLLMLLIPIFAALVGMLTKKSSWFATTLAAFVDLALVLFAGYILYSGGSLSETYAYAASLGVSFSLAANAYSIIPLLICAIVFVIASTSNAFFSHEEDSDFNVLFALSETAALGVFLSQDLFIFFLFWELAIVLAFFMIFRFGGSDRRYASMKFLMYSVFSSSMLLLGIMLIYAYSGHTFAISSIMKSAANIPTSIQETAFILLALAFMVKIPMFPFHSWMPDAYTEAPAGAGVVLAGILSKFGAYGLLLLFLLLPIGKEFGIYLAELALFSMLYAALTAIAQRGIKRGIAYASMVEMNIIVMAIASGTLLGMQGALFGMMTHALVVCVLLLGAFAIERMFGTINLETVFGVINESKFMAYAFVFGIFLFVGLPLTAGFASDILIFLGLYSKFGIVGLLPLVALLLTALYLFWIFERAFVGTHMQPRLLNAPGASVIFGILFAFAIALAVGLMPAMILHLISLATGT